MFALFLSGGTGWGEKDTPRAKGTDLGFDEDFFEDFCSLGSAEFGVVVESGGVDGVPREESTAFAFMNLCMRAYQRAIVA